ncbi:carboxypeptidase regulatory-like domain-containing protein [Haloarcula litorea]|uniref:carboxypeptidase regulatory-like domain-containing protein n=1 Tax=Haloarcula litorea TaxID=3032579 RepID=UPI0023E84BE4|nr:carboxypeptidase regulatory-like domain-containing protein [Halomicroarcula sp. GDY20]
MLDTTLKLRAVWLSALLVLSLLAFGVGTVPGGAVSGNVASNAAGNAEVTTSQTVAGKAADYSVSASYDRLSQDAETVRVNFTGTGAKMTYATVRDGTVTVSAGGQQREVVVSSRQVVENGAAVDITLAESLKRGSSPTVSFTLENVFNPGTAGDYDVTVDARSSGTTVQRADDQVSIIEGGDIAGTVEHPDGSAVTDDSTDVDIIDPDTGKTVERASYSASTGRYTATVPGGTYDVEVTSDGYARQVRTVSVANGGSVTQDVTMDHGGWLNGTVTDGSGTPLRGITVEAVRTSTNTVAASTTTAGDGSYSLALDPDGTYVVLASLTDSDDYDTGFREGVGVTDGATTTVNLTTPEIPDDGTISVSATGPDGTPITGATVSYRSSDYRFGSRTKTDLNGDASISTPAGTYLVRITTSAYGTRVVRGVALNESGTADVSVTFRKPATISGTVSAETGSVPKGTMVLISDGESFYPVQVTRGSYSKTVPPGDYTVSVFARGKSAPTAAVNATAGETNTSDFTLEKASIEASNVTITSGPGDGSNLGLRTDLQSGLVQLQLVDESSYSGQGVGKPDNLTSLGVTRQTEFRITLTVKNFDPNSLIWGLRNASWETSPNASVADGTDITITGSTVDLQAVSSKGVGPLLFQSPSTISWPNGRNAAADMGFTRTVYFGLFDLSTVPGPAQNNLNGISTTTNAQRFAPPTYDNGSLQVWMAAPSKNETGGKHTGFYQATIPDSQLNEWGVDDPETELDVSFKDQPRTFTVTETADGARILIENISYSAGYAAISPNETAIGSGGGGGDTTTDPTDDETTNTTASNETALNETAADDTVDNATDPVVAVSAVRNGSTGLATAAVATVTANQTVSVAFEDADREVASEPFTVARVNVTAATDVESLSVSAGRPSETVADVPELSAAREAAAVEYVEIDTSAAAANVSSATITVALNESEREALGVSRENVTVYRYHDGWQALNTTHVGDGEYRAESPGFSTFAVGGPQSTQQSTETNPAAPTETESPTETETETATPETPTSTETAAPSTAADSPTPTTGSGPGFGVVAALLAVLATALAARTRR